MQSQNQSPLGFRPKLTTVTKNLSVLHLYSEMIREAVF